MFIYVFSLNNYQYIFIQIIHMDSCIYFDLEFNKKTFKLNNDEHYCMLNLLLLIKLYYLITIEEFDNMKYKILDA